MYARQLEPVLRQALAEAPAVMLTGPRQSGKSTLARASMPSGRYVTLDTAATLAAATADPDGFLAGLSRPVALDEVQRAPQLLVAVKAAIDRDRRPGSFLLTGSADVLSLPTVTESLAGRVELLNLWPLSESEIRGRRSPFLSMLFEGTHAVEVPPSTRDALLAQMTRGSFPELAADVSPRRRHAWYASYITSMIQRDLRDLANIRHLKDVPRLLAILAGYSPGVVNLSNISRVTGIPGTSLSRYVTLLEQIFLIRQIPAWHADVARQQVRSERVLFTDTGLMAHLLGHTAATLASWDPVRIGALLENYVALEILKLASFEERPPALHHWRAAGGAEVDLVLRAPDGRLCGVEVKAASTVSAHDFKHLKALAHASGDRWVRGVVLYTGPEIVPFAPGFEAWPVPLLWAEDDAGRRD